MPQNEVGQEREEDMSHEDVIQTEPHSDKLEILQGKKSGGGGCQNHTRHLVPGDSDGDCDEAGPQDDLFRESRFEGKEKSLFPGNRGICELSCLRSGFYP